MSLSARIMALSTDTPDNHILRDVYEAGRYEMRAAAAELAAEADAIRDELVAALESAADALRWMSDCYVGEDDEAGECASCHERSYKPHAPDCKKTKAIEAARAALARARLQK